MTAPNYERPPLKAQPKGRPKLLDKRDAKAVLEAQDRLERLKCKQRSGGRCEVIEVSHAPLGRLMQNCGRPATENHHLIGGIGRRNKGKSILAAHRLDVCPRCHDEITGKVLVPVDGTKKEAAKTVRYERVK